MAAMVVLTHMKMASFEANADIGLKGSFMAYDVKLALRVALWF